MRNAIALVALAVMCFILACNKVQSQETPPPQVNATQDTAVEGEPAASDEADHVVTNENDFAKSYAERPKGDWIEEVPDLPKLEGWYRHLGSDEYWQDVFSFAGYVGVRSMNSLRVFDPASGKYIWEGRTTHIASGFRIVGGNGWICYGEHDTVAVDMDSGEILWKKEHFGPVAATGSSKEASVWLAKREYQRALGTVYEDVELQDLQSQEVLQSFADLTLLAVCGQSKGDSNVLVGRTPQGFQVFNAEGNSSGFEAPSFGGRIEMLVLGDVLVSLEEIPHNWNSENGDWEEWEKSQANRPKAMLIAYSLEGVVLWQLEIYRDFYFGDDSVMTCNDKLVVISLSPGLLACSLESGEILYQSPVGSNGGLIAEPLGDFVCWDGYDRRGMLSRISLFDPATGQGTDMLGGGQLDIKSVKPIDGKLFVLAETNPNGYGISGINYHLLLLNLGPDKLPLPGEMVKLNVPKNQSELADRFQESENPLANDSLLEEVKAGGINAFNPLLDGLADNGAEYLDTLGRLAVSMEESKEGPGGEGNSISPSFPKALRATDALLGKLSEVPKEEYSACIITWLDDPKMQSMHYSLLGVLAVCGGSAAGEYLSNYYEKRAVLEREIPQPQFKIKKRTYGSWAEVVLNSGERVVAFVNGGLVDDRDIYFGIDTNNDGMYEEVLPTGLTDTFYPGGFRETPENLKLAAEGDTMELTYNAPIFGEEVHDWDGESKTYTVVVATEFATATMSLAELRLDSDGDGLSDITEGMLLTNPDDPDTDGDGIVDELDLCPNFDPDSMGKLGRGVVRALDYYFQPSGQSPLVQSKEKDQIWAAVYFTMNDSGPVAYSQGGAAFGIALVNPGDTGDSPGLEKQFRGAKVVNVSIGGTKELGYSMSFSDSPSCYAEMLLAEIEGEIYPVRVFRRACTH